MKRKLKLYIWTDFCPDYTGGLAVAIAANEKVARRMILEKQGFDPGDWGTLTVHSVSRPFAACVSGGG